MYDLRNIKIIKLEKAESLKDNVAYKFEDESTGKELIAKMISGYEDADDFRLTSEFRKMVLLSGQPEIASVFFLATSELKAYKRNCYIMDYVKGQSLESFLNRGSLIYEVLFDLISQLSSGLEKAHNFEIYHNDLHNENIILSEDGYLKIIDFAWFEFNKPKLELRNSDIDNFKRILSEFEEKCRESDKKRFHLINKHCQNIDSFKGLSKELNVIDEISFDFSLLDEKSNEILAKLFQVTTLNAINMIVQKKELPIPENLIPPLTEKEKEDIEKAKNGYPLHILDTRIFKIESLLKNHFKLKLFSLKQVDLIDWEVAIINKGKAIEGPYKLNFRILFTSKFLKWKRVNEYLELVSPNERSLYDILLK